eukprot:TRINITY_DN7845_c0_g1_i1.p1 TRINITY_DN7845_c0_g1~~TRINITY_DN7845_c0_g1_i1.p1  ORF type:complete len:415 (+),score=106.58 TRINITY_DN7845_c0_g1_i1:83-1246(+)
MRMGTLIELATKYGVTLPSFKEEELRAKVFPPAGYRDLAEYLVGFQYLCAVMQKPEALERVAFECALDHYSENVFYVESRFAPQLHASLDFSLLDVIRAVDKGFKAAQEKINSSAEVKSGEKPAFHYGILVCAMRKFTPEYSTYFRQFFALHAGLAPKRVMQLASLAAAHAAVEARNIGLKVVGFDIAGEEKGYPAKYHHEAIQFCQENFLSITIHAGEAYGPESILQAVTELQADRIGHGFYLFDPSAIADPEILDKELFVKRLINYVSSRRICVEVCLTSNQHTHPELKDLKKHPFKLMLDNRVAVSLCVDNRLVSNSTNTNELQRAVTTFDMTPDQIYSVVLQGFKKSFFPGTFKEKLDYLDSIINYYRKVEQKFGVKRALREM